MHFIQISTGTFSLRTAMVLKLKITAWLLIFVRIILSNHVSLLFLGLSGGRGWLHFIHLRILLGKLRNNFRF